MVNISCRKIFFKRKYLTVGGILLVLGVFLYAQMTAAATYTWDNGGGDGLWSTCTNWSSDICPGSGDIATFDGSSVADSVIDASFAGAVRGVDINSGYTGTITQQKNIDIGSTGFSQDAGTFTQGTTTFTIENGSFTLSSGTFNTGLGVSGVDRNFTIDPAATYNASSTKEWSFTGPNGSDNTTLTCTGELGGIVAIEKNSTGATFTLSSNCIATTTNIVSITGNIINNGTLHLGTSVSMVNGSFTNNGTTTMTGTSFSLDRDFTQNGIFGLDGIAVNFTGPDGSDNSTLNCIGVFPATISIEKTSASFTQGAGCEATTTAVTITGANVINNGILHLGSSFYSSLSFTNNGTTTMTGTSFSLERDFTQNGVFDLDGITMIFAGASSADDTTLSCTGNLGGLIDITKTSTGAFFTLASGCIATTSDSVSSEAPITVNGSLHLGDSFHTGGSYTNNGTTTTDSLTVTIERNFTQNGVFDLDGIIMIFAGTASQDDTTLSCTGNLGGLIDITKTSTGAFFTLASGCVADLTTTTSSGGLILEGTLSTGGNTLTGLSLLINASGTLRLYANQTISPILSTGSTIEYYGSSTYTSLNLGTSYHNLIFSNGTYNLTSDLSVAGNFTNSGAVFNQTSGTTTFTGLSNTISGSNTFANLSKIATTSSSLIFPASETQTITGTMTLHGSSSSQRLSLEPFGQGQWSIDPQGTRDVNYLEIAFGNNINSVLWNCYDVDCTDGGGNTNIYFTEPLPTYRLRGGVRLPGGVRL